MKPILATMIVTLASYVLPSADSIGAPPDIPESGGSSPDLAPLDRLMREFIAEHDIPGASIAVAKEGRLVYARGFGYADLAAGRPVRPRSLFRIASISKPLTAAAILRLVEQEKLGLDERVVDILSLDGDERPIADERWREITVLQLLQHTGGWDRDVSFDAMFRPVKIARELGLDPPAGAAAVIRYMLAVPLDFPPGERYAYSNFGYCLLGRVIEKRSGCGYAELVRREVLDPLGIRRMRLGRTRDDGRARGEVTYYCRRGKTTGPSVFAADLDKEVPQPYGAWHLEAMDAHGGWIASAVDLVRFAAAFDDPAASPLLAEKTIGDMFARPPGAAGYEEDGAAKDVYYGLGWMVRSVEAEKGDEGKINTWHTGSLPGTSTILVRRHDGFCWAVLFNTRDSTSGEAPARIIDPLIHKAVDAVERWPRGKPLRPAQ